LWNNKGFALDLGILPGGSWSTAFCINVLRTVVGNANWSGAGSHAFVWTPQEGMRDLNSFIPANSGWELQAAVGVNIAGQIVGVGTINGQQHAFLLNPQCVC